MILSDRTIREALQEGRLGIDPLDETAIQPSSVDLRLSPQFRIFHNHETPTIDVRKNQQSLSELIEVREDEAFPLHPREFVLAATLERITLPDSLVARLEGKSSLGRLGLLVHSTAGFVDAGFRGQLTLELLNVTNLPILLYPNMRIAQVSFFEMSSPAEKPYGSEGIGSKYQEQQGPTASRFFEEYSED